MRIISPHPGYSVQISPPVEKVENDPISGQSYTRVEKQPLVADFEAGAGLFDHEVEMALQLFAGSFKGLPENVNPVTRIAVYDTEAHKVFKGWTDEFHQHVCDRFRVIAANAPSRLAIVPDNWRPAPWPAYDEQDADEILAYVGVLKFDAEQVRLYEGENQNREELMQSLAALRDGQTLDPSAPGEAVAVVGP